jgi:hypothetical protein
MGKYFVLLCAFAFVLLQFGFVSATLCTAACDAQYTTGAIVTWCGTDDNDHTTTQSAIAQVYTTLASDCYSLCGISVKHVGPCDCPNWCYNETGNGQCNTNKGECKCADGWKGADCSSIDCPNTCSGHGTCKKQSSSKGDDYCICNNGYTGYDCSVHIPQTFITTPYGSLPFGEYASSTPYFQGEDDGDTNPIFNSSVLATIKITVDEDDLDYLLNPQNRRTVDYVDAKMFFDNGVVSTYMDAEFRIKGFSSRILSKKSFNIKFDDKWHDVKGLGLKAVINDRATTYPLYVEMARSMKAQTYRVSLATLFVNGWFYGLMLMHERIDENFMESRFDIDDTEGNMYQMGGTYGQYLGSVSGPYQDLHTTGIFDNLPVPFIDQEEGNGEWYDLTMLFTVINSSTAAEPYFQQYFDNEHFIRYTAIDFATDNVDSYYGTGNNFMLINRGGFDNPAWLQFGVDFDSALQSPYTIADFLGISRQALIDMLNAGVTTYLGLDLLSYTLAPNPYIVNDRNNRPIANTVYSTPGANDTFTRIMTDLIQRVIFDKPGTLQARRQAYYDLSRSMVYRDKMFALPGYSMNVGPASFENGFTNTTEWLEQKYAYLGSLFVANGHGTCDAMANCVCNPHYSGPTCQTYTP